MATAATRLDDNAREEAEEIARTRGMPLTGLVRNQIDALLGRHVPIRDDVPHALSFQQRLVLAQQHEILALLHADDEDESRQRLGDARWRVGRDREVDMPRKTRY